MSYKYSTDSHKFKRITITQYPLSKYYLFWLDHTQRSQSRRRSENQYTEVNAASIRTKNTDEKWREAAKILQEHNALGLKRTGLGVVLDSDKPHLIGLDEDILSTGITLYQLKEGETVIGNLESDEIPHIILKGPRYAGYEIIAVYTCHIS